MADELNKFSTALQEIYDARVPFNVSYAVRVITPGEHADDIQFTFVHRFRYLHFYGSGKLVDPSGIGDDVSFQPIEDMDRGILDLDSVDWLIYGARYHVQFCAAAMEDQDP